MKTKVWDGLVDIWLKPEWKKKFDANRLNKVALPDALLHTGESLSFGEHKRRMEESLSTKFHIKMCMIVFTRRQMVNMSLGAQRSSFVEKEKEAIFYSYNNRYINGFAKAMKIAKHPSVVSIFLNKKI